MEENPTGLLSHPEEFSPLYGSAGTAAHYAWIGYADGEIHALDGMEQVYSSAGVYHRPMSDPNSTICPGDINDYHVHQTHLQHSLPLVHHDDAVTSGPRPIINFGTTLRDALVESPPPTSPPFSKPYRVVTDPPAFRTAPTNISAGHSPSADRMWYIAGTEIAVTSQQAWSTLYGVTTNPHPSLYQSDSRVLDVQGAYNPVEALAPGSDPGQSSCEHPETMPAAEAGRTHPSLSAMSCESSLSSITKVPQHPIGCLPDHHHNDDVAASPPPNQGGQVTKRSKSKSQKTIRPSPSPQSRGPGMLEQTFTLELNMPKKPAEKKPVMACLFCRERKIACGPPPEDSADRTCKQCKRRHLKCEYPTESHRGQRRGGRKKKNATDAPAGLTNPGT